MKPPIDVDQKRVNRRAFSRMSLAALGGTLVTSACSKSKQASQSPGGNLSNSSGFFTSYGKVSPKGAAEQIQYIREDIAHFEIPPYRGLRYQDSVPDTLDIAERAKLGLNVLTSITDPSADYEIYWVADFARDPPAMAHDFNDWVMNCEGLMEALPLLRHATGDNRNDEVDPVWMKSLLRSVGPDGLVYIPLKGRPWSRINVPSTYIDPVWTAAGKSLTISDSSIKQIATPVTCERMIATMALYYLRDQNPIWKNTTEQIIRRLSMFAMAREDYAYLPGGSVEPDSVYKTGEMPSGFMAEETSGRLVQALSQYYRTAGYEPARELAAKLTRYLRYHAQYYEPDGRPLVGADERNWFRAFDIANVRFGGHGHGHALGLLSVLEYAVTVNDSDTLAFVKSGYEWLKANGSSRTGFFPEIFVPRYDRCEADTIADMVAMALKLSVAGVGDYWDDADRWARNHFSESQLTDPSWVHRLADRSPSKLIAPNETGERVPERNVGAFAGWSTGNDWVVPSAKHTLSIQHCCTGNACLPACRALYYLWEHILDFKNASLNVNLLLNRASQWGDVYSYIPFEGKVEIKIKQPCNRVRVRMPEWISTNQRVTADVNNRARSTTWHGRYVDIGNAKPGDKLSLQFPLPESKVRETIGDTEYTLEIRGNSIISIDPPGRNGPLYERAYYRKPTTWKKVDRFVPEATLFW